MKARAVIRDVCRVKSVPLAEADRLAKLVPDHIGVTLDNALKTEPQLKDACEKDPRTREVIDICKRLEGLTRHASVHAAGVVIADEPLTNFIPLYKAPDSDDIVTQFEGPLVEKVGLLKMDFLGLKTLSVLARAAQLVKEIHNADIDLEKIDVTDPAVFQLFAGGRTKGLFQFESGGMQDLLMKMKPDRIQDLIAANALYRPGPMTLKKEKKGNCQGKGELHTRLSKKGPERKTGRGNLRPHRTLRRIWLQQESLHTLCLHCLPDRIHENILAARIYGRSAHL
jgi:DNA polymerase-3 subunit alpha